MQLTHSSQQLGGIIPPVPTLFNSQGRFDSVQMGMLIDHLVSTGIHGLFFLGTAGEFAQLTAEQREEVAEFCINHTNGRLPVWIGTGSNTTTEAVRLTKHAVLSGADGVVVINPYYNALSDEALFRHYGTILENCEKPLMLYNFPALTGQDLSPSLVRRLAASYPGVAGIKETVDQLSHIREMVQQVKEVNPDFAVFCGFDEYLLATLACGGAGAIAASANFAPELLLGIYHSFQEGNFTELMNYQRRIIEIPPLYALDKPFITAIKEAIRLSGLAISTFSQPPAVYWDDEKERQLLELLRKAQIPTIK